MASWVCPACGRKVPGYSANCHCGVDREAAAQAVPPAFPQPGSGPVRFRAADVPRVAWVALGIVVLALLAGLWRLMQPPEPNPIPPLLGHWDHGAPPPAKPLEPRATPEPGQTEASQRPVAIITPMPLTDDRK